MALWSKLMQHIRSRFFKYTCNNARYDIEEFFLAEDREDPKAQQALFRAMNHMTMVPESRLVSHAVRCVLCWDFYTRKKQDYCGG